MSKQIQSLKLSNLRPKIAVRNYKNGSFPTFGIGSTSFTGYYFVPIVNSNYSDINLCRVEYLISFSSTGSNQIIDWDLDFGDGESATGYKLENPILYSNITSNSSSLKCKLDYGSDFISLPSSGTVLIDDEYINYSGKSFNFTTSWSSSTKYGASRLTKTLSKDPFKITSMSRENNIVTLTTELYHNIEPNESLIISNLPTNSSRSIIATGLNGGSSINMGINGNYLRAGMILTGTGIRSASTTATQATVGSRSIVVASATGIAVGHFISASGIPSDTQVTSISGATIYISKYTIAALNSTPINFFTKITNTYSTTVNTTATQTTSGSFTITVGNVAGIAVGSTFNSVEGIPTSTVVGISGNTLTLDNATTKSISNVPITFFTSVGQISPTLSSALTGSTAITGDWGDNLNGTVTTIDGTKDNIIKYTTSGYGNVEIQNVFTGSAFVNQIQLEDVDEFASSGSVLIDKEVINYTGKAAIGSSTALGTGRSYYNSTPIILGDIDVGDDSTSIIVSSITGLPNSGTVLIDDEHIYYGSALEENTTGTITQLNETYEVVGSGTTFTSGMVGATLIYADGQTAKIVAYKDATHLTVDQNKTISSNQSFRIPHQLINCRRGANGTDAVEHELVTNEIQTVTVSNATGGNFKLTFNGLETANIAHDASAATVQTALIGLTNITDTGVIVTDNRYDGNGDAISPAPNGGTIPLVFYIEFTGEHKYTDVSLLTVADTLTGTGHSVVVGTETAWATSTPVRCLTFGAVQVTSGEFKVGNTITGNYIQSGTTIMAIDSSVYSTGTITQADYTVTGAGTSFTADMIGSTITYADKTTAIIINVISGTSLRTSQAKTITTGSTYSIATTEFTLSKPATAAWEGVLVNQTTDGDVVEALTGLTRGTQETISNLHLEDSFVGQIAVYKNKPYVCILSNNDSGTEPKNPDDNSLYWYPIDDQDFVITLNNLSRSRFGSSAASHTANTQICSVAEISHLYKYDGGGDAGTILHEAGTIAQSGYTVTGTGTTFTSGMVGQILKYANESPLPDIPVLNGSPVSSGSTGLSAGTYYYLVTATNVQGESLSSAVSSAITISGTKTITVDWLTVDGATGYKVYRSTVNKNFTTSNTALAATIGSGNTLTYADTGSGTTGATPPVVLPKPIASAEITAVNAIAQTLTVNKSKTVSSGATYQIWSNPGVTHQNGVMNVILTGTDNHNRKFATRTTVYPKYINETLLTT